MKKARSIFNFDTARVGFRTSCLRKSQLGAVLLVLCVTSGLFMVCVSPFLDTHYGLILKKLFSPEIGLGFKCWQ